VRRAGHGLGTEWAVLGMGCLDMAWGWAGHALCMGWSLAQHELGKGWVGRGLEMSWAAHGLDWVWDKRDLG
jgi:hypothetical protein